MSWFNRRPRTKEPQKHIPHHRRSPVAEKMLKEAKQSGPDYKENKKPTSHK
jgi:hypothetical protein